MMRGELVLENLITTFPSNVFVPKRFTCPFTKYVVPPTKAKFVAPVSSDQSTMMLGSDLAGRFLASWIGWEAFLAAVRIGTDLSSCFAVEARLLCVWPADSRGVRVELESCDPRLDPLPGSTVACAIWPVFVATRPANRFFAPFHSTASIMIGRPSCVTQ